MKSYWAIVKLTSRNAFRSHIFQLLLLLLLAAVIVIPTTVSGDGTAGGFIRVSLLYSLSTISTILALSSVWLGCHAMTQDIDNYQLHMVVTKPVSRIKVWLAKWTGVYLIQLLLLLVSSTAIYFLILYQYNKQDFPEQERQKIRNEVMVGRRVFLPEKNNYEELSREIVKERIERLRSQGKEVDVSHTAQELMLKDARRDAIVRDSELSFDRPREYVFAGLPEGFDRPLFLRYRPYVGKVASEGQRQTRSLWVAQVPRLAAKQDIAVQGPQAPRYEYYPAPLSEFPEQVMSGEFHEKVLMPEWKLIGPDLTLRLIYVNLDEAQERQYFQPIDGPKLLIEVAGFFENYMRAVAVIALELLILTGLGCAFGGIMTLPTAIFVAVSYLFFGSIAVYMVNVDYVSGAADHIGQLVAKMLLWVVIPLQAFGVSGYIANGEIIELSYFWLLFKNYFLLRALPLFLLGVILYRRRELGLVIRK